MNKYIFILGLAVIALISGCTSDDLTMDLSLGEERVSIVEASQDSDVPISLGVGSSRGMTRAVLNPTDESGIFDTEDGKFLGVFCLATGTQSNVDNIPSEISTNKWVKDDATGLLVRLSNVPAKIEDGDVKFVDPANTSNPKHYYYPMINWMTYNFYAYYPRENDSKIKFTTGGSGALVRYITIDGSQDVIWGKTHPEKAPKVSSANDADPFCAKYFQLKKDSIANSPDPTPGNIAALYPKFEFKHLLSQFKFSIEPKDAAAWAAISVGGGMSITNMYVSNAISNLQLIVANKANPETEGTLSKKDDTTGNLYIKANGKDYNLFSSTTPLESQVSSIAVDESQVSVSGYIMLPPSGVGTEDYELCLEYSIGGTPQAKPMKVKMIPPAVPGSDPVRKEFEAGKVYNIVVKVKL